MGNVNKRLDSSKPKQSINNVYWTWFIPNESYLSKNHSFHFGVQKFFALPSELFTAKWFLTICEQKRKTTTFFLTTNVHVWWFLNRIPSHVSNNKCQSAINIIKIEWFTHTDTDPLRKKPNQRTKHFDLQQLDNAISRAVHNLNQIFVWQFA